MKGGRRQGGQRKRWEDNIREWTGLELEFGKSQRAVENGKMEKTGRKIICGAPTNLAVEGLMMVIMMMMSVLLVFSLLFAAILPVQLAFCLI